MGAICLTCNQEMRSADSCVGGVDPSVVTGSIRCPDCHVAPGGTHHPGCDNEHCSVCGNQAISCPCWGDREEGEEVEPHDPLKARWTGEPASSALARKLGLWCRCLYSDGRPVLPGDFAEFLKTNPSSSQFHVPCAAGDEGATEDLNRTAVVEVQLRAGLTLHDLGFSISSGEEGASREE